MREVGKSILIESIYVGESSSRTGYGIALIEDDASVIQSVSDLSCDRTAVEQFVLVCNDLLLSPEHLMDAVDDFEAGILGKTQPT